MKIIDVFKKIFRSHSEEQERIQKEKEEQERIQKEKEEQERIQKEKEEQERIQKEKEEQERIQKEKEEKKRIIYEHELEKWKLLQEKEKEALQISIQKEKEERERLRIQKEKDNKQKFKNKILAIGYVYNNIYGKGRVEKITDSAIYVAFSSKNTKYLFPNAFNEKILTLEPNEEYSKRTKFQNSNSDEFLIEKKYFENTRQIASKNIDFLDNEVTMMSYEQMDIKELSQAGKISFKKTYDDLYNQLEQWRSIDREPYFAKVIYNDENHNCNTIYIGKFEVPNYVIDWRNDICIIYYQYNNYINNPSSEIHINLLRDFDIKSGLLLGFNDRYNYDKTIKNNEKNNDIITDERLIKIIKKNKGSRQIHDIIESIRKNQYDMITQDMYENIMILGCAGSGKTMVMLHRISYIIFKNKLDVKNIYILSPNKLLNMEVDSLSSILNLKECHRYSIHELYYQIIEDFLLKCANQNIYKSQKYKPNYIVDDKVLKEIYSKNMIYKIKEYINQINDRLNVRYELFLNKKIENYFQVDKNLLKNYSENIKELHSKYSFLSNQNLGKVYKNITILMYDLDNNLHMYDKNGKFNMIDNFPRNKEINNIISNLTSILRLFNILYNTEDDLKLTYLRTIKDLFKKICLMIKKKFDDLFIKDVEHVIENIIIDIKNLKEINTKGLGKKIIILINEIKNYLNDFEEIKFKREVDIKFKNINYSLVDKYYKCLEDSEMLSVLYLQGVNITNDYNQESIVDLNIKYIIDEIKNQYNLSGIDIYEFELYLYCIILKEYGLLKPISNKFVHIDEFQDLSDTEIQFLDIYFKNSIFNYYGDFLQSINSKGEKEFKYEIKKFYINENYRNAYEITNYVNKNLNLNMIPIGLTGYVEKIDYSDIINKNLCNSSDRVALIVKDLFEFKEAYEQYECYHYIENDNMNIKRDKINIIPLIYSKGLEFETVIVIENDMSRDELYVSYTRALNNLYIIK